MVECGGDGGAGVGRGALVCEGGGGEGGVAGGEEAGEEGGGDGGEGEGICEGAEEGEVAGCAGGSWDEVSGCWECGAAV